MIFSGAKIGILFNNSAYLDYLVYVFITVFIIFVQGVDPHKVRTVDEFFIAKINADVRDFEKITEEDQVPAFEFGQIVGPVRIFVELDILARLVLR